MSSEPRLTAVNTLNNKVSVSGTALVYSRDNSISVREAVPQGINPQELIVEVLIDERPGPLKGQFASFSEVFENKDYKSVRARFLRSSLGENEKNEDDQVAAVVTKPAD